MGDTTDGSSNAAQGAPDEDGDEMKRGFIGRFFDAFSGATDTPGADPDKPHLIYPQPAMPGMRNLRSMRVEDVAIPKSDIVAVSVNLSQEELMEVFRESGLTRLPAYDGTLDTPLGNVNMKDFALGFGFQQDAGPFDMRDILRPLLFVPPSMPLGVLLQKMQQERKHMALVIDEYGGTDGLVTIEDLIEQVVGAIEDEHDVEEEKQWVMESPGVYSVLAKSQLAPFEAEIGMALTAHDEIDEEEIDTLGGLVFMLSGHVPARGEIVSHPDGVEFEVIDADPRRIKRLRVRLPHAKDG